MLWVVKRVPMHPTFRANFTSSIYRSRTEEYAPFGSDEGSDLLEEWSDRITELSEHTTLQTILLDGAENHDALWNEFHQPSPPTDLDAIAIASGFVLLRLTGRIDDDGRALVLDALQRSRRHSPLGQRWFDQMISDLGGQVPDAPAMSDELREMLDPDFGAPSERHSWLFLAHDPTARRPPSAYQQHLSWLRRNLNDREEWWRWWDAGFPHQPTVLDGWITFDTKPRRTSVRSAVDGDWRWITVSIGASDAAFAHLDRQQMAAYSLSFVEEARSHISTILSAAAKKHGLGAHPEIPRTKREARHDLS